MAQDGDSDCPITRPAALLREALQGLLLLERRWEVHLA